MRVTVRKKMNDMRRTFIKQKVSFFLILLIIFIPKLKVYSQFIFFPTEKEYFIPDNNDSVFIFTDNLAVTASGQNLERLQLKHDEIYGEDIPPTLKLRNPIGAILYHRSHTYAEIPVFIGRLDYKIPIDRLVRKYFLNFSNLKGHTAKGGITITVWQKNSAHESFLIFLNSGQVCGSDVENWFNIPTKNLSLFDIAQLAEIERDIAGVWIYPPEIGVNQITAEILRLMQTGPLLVEYWDGLGWQFLEQAFLSQVIENIPGDVRMAFSLFPPKTEVNYSAMVSGGLPEIADKRNLFFALDSLNIEYQVLEGERLIFPIPGNVKMHTASSPEQEDAEIFYSALSIIKKSDPRLLLLHYHGLDDLSHSLGLYDPRMVKHFQMLWDWHDELRKNWQGNILIVSDHGRHAIKKNDQNLNQNIIIKNTRGTHGDFIFSDMAVPIIVQAGLGKKRVDFKLTAEQTEQIWNMLGTPISLKEEKN